MKELLENIIRRLVTNQDEVAINEIIDGSSVVYEVTVAKEDVGKVIGKQGRIAKAIRTVVKAAALKENKHVSVEIM